MKKVSTAALLAAAAWSVSSFAVELPDCRLGKIPQIHESPRIRPRAETTRLELDSVALKTGQEITYGRDEAVLNADFKVVKFGTVLVANSDFVVKSGWLTNRDFVFKKGQTINATRELLAKDGTALVVFYPVPDRVLFLTQDGEFCNQAMMADGREWHWAMGHLSRVPDEGRLQWQDSATEVASGRLRIIYTGSAAGAMHFQEVRVKGNQIASSTDRQFDQFATDIVIADLKFHVSAAKADSVRVSYDFGPQVDLGSARVGR